MPFQAFRTSCMQPADHAILASTSRGPWVGFPALPPVRKTKRVAKSMVLTSQVPVIPAQALGDTYCPMALERLLSDFEGSHDS